MSVVVRMEMPKACSWIENGEKKKCPISEWGGACAITKQFKMPDGCRPSWCPIICSLPEGHGPLVDSEEDVSKYITIWDCNCSEFGRQTVMAVEDLQYLPLIVPAERSEKDGK